MEGRDGRGLGREGELGSIHRHHEGAECTFLHREGTHAGAVEYARIRSCTQQIVHASKSKTRRFCAGRHEMCREKCGPRFSRLGHCFRAGGYALRVSGR